MCIYIYIYIYIERERERERERRCNQMHFQAVNSSTHKTKRQAMYVCITLRVKRVRVIAVAVEK
jgi:hypothetical protein